MKYLIVSADDFGITESVNEGIAIARRDGIVTSVNLFPSGEAYPDALVLAKSIGLKEAGAHLALTETKPVSKADEVPTLVTSDGGFYRNRGAFLPRLVLGKVDLDHVYTELRAQLGLVIDSGITVTNLSSHEHIHMMPKVLDIFIKLAKEYDIPAIRYPHKDISARRFDPGNIYKSFVLSCFEPGMARVLKSSSIRSPDHFRGFLDSAKITEETLLGMIEALEDGTTELVSHPGFVGPEVVDRYSFHRGCEAELFALTSRRVRKALDEMSVKLISYGEFLSI